MKIAYVLSDGPTATTDYFLFPELETVGYTPVLLDTSKISSGVPLNAKDSLVVISRYLPPGWNDVLSRFTRRGGKIVYFMDDDLLDLYSLRRLPLRYSWKILRQAISQKWRLKRLCTEFWVSTPNLAKKYAELHPRIIQAVPSPALMKQDSTKLQICYHGTASHRDEIGWLRDVVYSVQSLSTNTHFEIFGGTDVKRHYKGIPRVSVIHSMRWPEYLSWSGAVKRDIALAPLLPTTFNTSRGPTKFFDYTRIGAAGIYTDAPPYQEFIRDGVDGVLIGNQRDAWVEAILGLAADAKKRKAIATSARMRSLCMSDSYEGIPERISISTG